MSCGNVIWHLGLQQLVNCRGDRSEMQGSATDGGPDPSAKKIKVHMDADGKDASDGRKLTEAERRRIRRSFQAICASVHPACCVSVHPACFPIVQMCICASCLLSICATVHPAWCASVHWCTPGQCTDAQMHPQELLYSCVVLRRVWCDLLLIYVNDPSLTVKTHTAQWAA